MYEARAPRQMPFQLFCGKKAWQDIKFFFHYSSTKRHNLAEFRSTSQPEIDKRPTFGFGRNEVGIFMDS